MSRKVKKGQGLVEFALILPILMLVLLGIIEGAYLIWVYITVQNSAREAARYAVTGQPLDAFGNPWNSDPVNARLPAIINVARGSASGLPIDQHADWIQYEEDGGDSISDPHPCYNAGTVTDFFECFQTI